MAYPKSLVIVPTYNEKENIMLQEDCRTHSYLDYGYAPLLRDLHGVCLY